MEGNASPRVEEFGVSQRARNPNFLFIALNEEFMLQTAL
jgi:hypothetical protein